MRRLDRNEIIEDNILRLQQRMSLRVRGAEGNEGLQLGFLKQSRVSLPLLLLAKIVS